MNFDLLLESRGGRRRAEDMQPLFEQPETGTGEPDRVSFFVRLLRIVAAFVIIIWRQLRRLTRGVRVRYETVDSGPQTEPSAEPMRRRCRKCSWTSLAALTLCGIIVTLIILIFKIARSRDMEEKNAMLESKLKFFHMEIDRKQELIRNFQAQLNKRNWNETQRITSEQKKIYDTIMSHLKNISGVRSSFVMPVPNPEPLQAALTYSMPYTKDSPTARSPAFQIISPRKSTDIDIVIGIPTVKRAEESYLIDTVKSLIDGMIPQQLKKTLIIIFIGEADDLSYVVDTAYTLNMMFRAHFGSLIEVISPTKYWYPQWEDIPATLWDSVKRSHWRTKQNLDAIFLMAYAQTRGPYYLMLEDDVLAKKGFMTEMLAYVHKQLVDNPKWIVVYFNNLGGFGKLFRTEDMMLFCSYLQIYYQYMPIDWLLEYFISARVCGLDVAKVWHLQDQYNARVAKLLFGNEDEKCATLHSNARPFYNSGLFEHAGMFSSLRGKIHKVKGKLRIGKVAPTFSPCKNPPVRRISSSIKSTKHTIDRAYHGKDFFEGVTPKTNDTIDFWFDPSLKLDRFFIKSGSLEKQGAIAQGGAVVEILPHLQKSRKKFILTEEFDEFGNCMSKIDSSVGPLAAVRIRILKDMHKSLIISKIELVPSTKK